MNTNTLTKPFRKAMKQAEKVKASGNSRKEIRKLLALIKGAIYGR